MPSFRLLPLFAAAWCIAACDSETAPVDPPGVDKSEAPAPPDAIPPAKIESPSGSWTLQASAEGTELLLQMGGKPMIRLFCPLDKRRILVNIPGFRPIGSEERLSFGSGGTVVALVADTRGDAQRGGVSGTGDVPDGLAALISGPLSASYGAQATGPHPAPPKDVSEAFIAACSQGSTTVANAAESASISVGACRMQGSDRLGGRSLRAVGTEPFWGARIEGRCVTYSHPEDQDGTRVWTRYAKGPAGEIWSGALGGRPFELRIRPEPGCSDGMSDRRYPLAVDLTVNGEKRSGCAEPV